MRRFVAQSLIEYGLLIATVVVLVIAALAIFGGTLTSMFNSINSQISNAV